LFQDFNCKPDDTEYQSRHDVGFESETSTRDASLTGSDELGQGQNSEETGPPVLPQAIPMIDLSIGWKSQRDRAPTPK